MTFWNIYQNVKQPAHHPQLSLNPTTLLQFCLQSSLGVEKIQHKFSPQSALRFGINSAQTLGEQFYINFPLDDIYKSSNFELRSVDFLTRWKLCFGTFGWFSFGVNIVTARQGRVGASGGNCRQ